MARHYSTKDFFRQMPNALLARYFQARKLMGDVDFAAMKETQPDALFSAWLYLPDNQRNEIDAEFRDIFELSCEKGFRAIVDESEWDLSDDEHKVFVTKLSNDPNATPPLKSPFRLMPRWKYATRSSSYAVGQRLNQYFPIQV